MTTWTPIVPGETTSGATGTAGSPFGLLLSLTASSGSIIDPVEIWTPIDPPTGSSQMGLLLALASSSAGWASKNIDTEVWTPV